MEKGIWKFVAGLLFLFLVLVGFFSGCAKKKEAGVITLRWVSDPNPLRKEQIERFEKVNPGIKVNLDWSSGGMEKILTQTAGGNPPDLFDCYTPEQLRIFAKKGAVLDVTDYCKRDNVNLRDIIWPQCDDYIYYQGRVYSIPTNAGTFVLFYNKKIFDKEGIPYPDDTWTWDKFLEIAKKLTKINPEKKYYEYFGTGINNLENFLPWQYGVDFYSPDGKKCVSNSEEYKEAFRFIYDLRYKYHVTPTAAETENIGSSVSGWGQGEQNLFASQKLAMLFYGRWGIITMRKIKDLEWGIAPVPYPTRGKRVTLFISRSTLISSKTKYPEEAFKFLKFLLSKDYNETIAQGGDSIPAVISLCKSDFFLKDPAYPKETQNQIYIDAVSYSRPTRLSPYFNELEVERIKKDEIDKMWAGIQKPDETLDNITQRVNLLSREK